MLINGMQEVSNQTVPSDTESSRFKLWTLQMHQFNKRTELGHITTHSRRLADWSEVGYWVANRDSSDNILYTEGIIDLYLLGS